MMSGKVILGTDGSTVVSTDGGNNFAIVSNTISNHELWGFGSTFNSDLLAAGCNHGPLMLRDYEAPGGWYTVLGADQGNSDFNPLDNVTAYSQGYDSYHVTRTGIKSFTNGSQQIDPGGIYSYFNTMEFHPNLYYTLITHHAGQFPSSVPQATKNIWKKSLIRSDDNGLTVNVVHTFSAQLLREKICIGDTNRIYTVVGLTNNNLLKSADGGATWADITPSTAVTGTAVRNISDIAVSDVVPNEIWVTYSGVQNTCQVLRSTDGGVTYTNLTSSILTSNPMTKIVFQRGTNGGVYVGNTSGIYYKNDAMPNWVKLGNGLPQMEMRFMFINYYKGKLLIGTSRGAWDHNLYEHSSTKAQVSASTLTPSCAAPTVQFRDYSVVSGGGTGATYSWGFPGGTPASSTIQNPLVSYAGNTNGSLHDVTLTVTDQYGTNSKTFTNFISYDASNCCQSTAIGWTKTDIGTAATPGELCFTASTGNFKITCHASGLTDPNDSLPFVYQALVGSGQIIARVKDVSSTYNYLGGIMVRNSLAANSAFVCLSSLDNRGAFVNYRTTDGGTTGYQAVTALAMPMWLKLIRQGNIITSYYSTDGITWTTYHTNTLTSLNNMVYVGMVASRNGCITDIDNVSVTTNNAPAIATQPVSQTICPAGTATFNVIPSGTGPFTYQWQISNNSSGDFYSNVCSSCGTGPVITGGTSQTLTEANIPAFYGNRQFRVVVTNSGGSVTSSPAQLTINTPITIIDLEPVGQTICTGGTAAYSVTPVGTGPLTYQWQQYNGSNWANFATDGNYQPYITINGSKTANLILTPGSANNVAQVRAIVTNSCGQDTSLPVLLTVGITITQQPSNQNSYVNNVQTFTIVAPSAGLTYQWQQYDGNNWNNFAPDGEYAPYISISGSQTPTLTIVPQTANNVTMVRVVVTGTGTGCSLASNPATVTVNTIAPLIVKGAKPTAQKTDVMNTDTSFPKKGKAIVVYPNPARNSLAIAGLDGKSTIVFYNMMGQQVRSITADGSLKTIGISELASGLYVVKIIDADNNTTIFKIIKD